MKWTKQTDNWGETTYTSGPWTMDKWYWGDGERDYYWRAYHADPQHPWNEAPRYPTSNAPSKGTWARSQRECKAACAADEWTA